MATYAELRRLAGETNRPWAVERVIGVSRRAGRERK